MKQRWLQDWPWETVVTINAGLCKETNALRNTDSTISVNNSLFV